MTASVRLDTLAWADEQGSPDPADALDPPSLCRFERKLLLDVACLYRVVLARRADPEGLIRGVERLRDGVALEQIAREMTASDEARRQGGHSDVSRRLVANALDRDPAPDEAAMEAPTLAATLARDPAVWARYPLFEDVFPDGIRLDDLMAYRWWLEEQAAARAKLHGTHPTGDAAPLLTLVIPVEDGAAGHIAPLLAALREQTDPRLETILVPRRAVEAGLRAIVAAAPATRLVREPRWRADEDALDRALDAATGTFVALLGTQDRLDPGTVAELALLADSADIVLTDEDRIGPGGLLRDPLLGGAWDPDLAMAQPPRGLVVVRRTLARTAGGLHRPADGEAAWDLLLRAARQIPAARIRHVPAVLLHRGGPTLLPGPGAAATRLARLRHHLAALGLEDCRIEEPGGLEAPLRIVHPLPAVPPKVSIIVPTRDRADLLRTCMAGLLERTDYPDFEVLIIDNDSQEQSTRDLFEELRRDRRVRVLWQGGAFNWSAFNNRAVAVMRGDVAVLLNNDTDVIDRDWLRELVAQAIRPDVGLVSPKLLYGDGTIQHAGTALAGGRGTHVWRHAPGDAPGYDNHLSTVRTFTAATGACLAIRRSVFDEVGGIEADHLKVAWNDTDLCLRVKRAGYRVVVTPFARLYHIELATRGSDDRPEAAVRFALEHAHMLQTWGGALDDDPHFSPNLMQSDHPPRLVARPRWLA